jgi:hypothetical protein
MAARICTTRQPRVDGPRLAASLYSGARGKKVLIYEKRKVEAQS